MAYPDRVAVTGDPIAITFTKLVDLPAYPEPGTGWLTALFWCGRVSQTSNQPATVTANKPVLMVNSYQNTGDPGPTGAVTFGISHADYGIRTLGIGVGDNNNQYDEQAYIDGMHVGFTRVLNADDTTDCYFLRQVVGDLTGGDNAPVTMDANPETQTLAWDTDLNALYCSFMGAALGSNSSNPAALEICNPQYDTGDNDLYVGLKIPDSGAITRLSLFKGDVATHGPQGDTSTIDAQCRDATHHYFIRSSSPTYVNFTICSEVAYPGDPSYTNYTAKFDDPDLPSSFADLFWEIDTDYTFTACYGTDVGFLISYKKLGVPKFILVDREWTTVQHITATAGDATATAILAQGAASVFDDGAISMMMDSGYSWMLGGDADAPLVVEGTAPVPIADGEGDGLTDESLRLRVWEYKLDGHAFAVFRVGPSESLIYDLTTGQFSNWKSPGRDNWRAHVGQNWIGMGQTTFARGFGSDVVCGDDASNVLWVLDPTYGRDDRSTTGDDFFDREATGLITVDGRETVNCGAVTMSLSLGNPTQTGATITLETSDDLGQNWYDHGSNTIASGEYSAVVEWRALGLARAPGRLFRFTDNGAATRISCADLR